MRTVTAAILTIGTEITDGQIVDRNSQWISDQLTQLGIEVRLHASMPDDQNQIVQFLKTNIADFDVVVLGGGLGPTSDDLTRYAVAEFLNRPLVLHDDSWSYIQDRLNKRNVTVREAHKTQAMIPQGSSALSNSAGSAPGIHVNTGTQNYFLVPGPPKELQAIWHDHVLPFLNTLNIKNTRRLKIWTCNNIAESEIAHITEEFFKGRSFVNKIGYRLIRKQPENTGWFVEVKVWHEETPESISALAQFESLIKEYLASGSAV